MEKNTSATPAQEGHDRLERIGKWVRANERKMTIVAGAAALVGAGVWFALSAKQRRETFARRELDRARLSAESGNLPLAANDLSRIIAGYGGTAAGQEAQLLLAQVHVLQDQPALAVTQMQEFVAAGPKEQYRAQAYEALGVALEQTGQFRPAAEAYAHGADASRYSLLAGRLLLSAGQAYVLAGDTAAAVQTLQRVVSEFGSTPLGSEARVRLGELGRFDG
jgi:TolA-binding protein